MVDGTPEGEQELINGRYRLIEVIGRGGMGTVWRGHDAMLDREVAIKRVRFSSDLDEEERAELGDLALREARATARLNHPGIVTIHDVIDDDGAPIIVMELLKGRPLAEILRTEVRLPYRRVAEIGAAVLDALREAHDVGIVHRDLKPANVLISDRRIVLTDFGVAQRVGERADGFDDVLGTPAFMAPEQAENAAASPAGDLWSLGAVLFNAVEGRPPFQGPDHATVLLTLLTQEAPALVNGGPLRPLIKALLTKDPERRPTAEEAAARLDAILRRDDGAQPALPSPASPPPAGNATNPAAPPDAAKATNPAAPPRSGTRATKPAASAPSSAASAPSSAASASSPAAPSAAGPGSAATSATGTSGASSRPGSSATGSPAEAPGTAARPRTVPSSSSPAPRAHSVPTGHAPLTPAQRGRRALTALLLTLPPLGVVYSCMAEHSPTLSSGMGANPSYSSGAGTGLPAGPSSTPGHAAAFKATAFSPDGDLVAFGDDHGEVRLYGTASKRSQGSFDVDPASGLPVDALAFSPDGRSLAVGSGGDVKIWDVKGRELRGLDGFKGADDFSEEFGVEAMAFSPDGRTLTAVGESGLVGVWTLRTREYDGQRMSSRESSCKSGALSADATEAACMTLDGDITVWDVEKKHAVAQWPGYGQNLGKGLALSPDGATIAVAEEPNSGQAGVRLWDVRDPDKRTDLAGVMTSPGNALVFGADGRALAFPAYSGAADSNGQIEVWKVPHGGKKAAWNTTTPEIWAMAVSRDGRLVATADVDGAVLWNARSGEKAASWHA
ncbi:serine/threonine-protein kinase [Actinoallomurus sp. NPDC052274]|uniref:WD40 repeat domain-containing serine/threonine protein kinase n=1 Tax=Actinoallomurus sp. NPDC052274 TaxID=3155420 RepID=UPI00343D3164